MKLNKRRNNRPLRPAGWCAAGYGIEPVAIKRALRAASLSFGASALCYQWNETMDLGRKADARRARSKLQ
jgi:hypothetical protein